MPSEFIDQSVVTGGSGTISVPIPVTAMTGDLVIAFGIARQSPATSLYTFGPNVWVEDQSNGTSLDGVDDSDPFIYFCVRKLFAGETDLVLTPTAITINHVQTVLQVWRGAANLFAGPAGEYENFGGGLTPLSSPKPTTSTSEPTADPSAIVGGNIAFNGVFAFNSTDIQISSAEGFTNYALETNIRIDVRGFTQGEGGSSYPTPSYTMSPASFIQIFSVGFSGAPEPINTADWTIPALQWSAAGTVTEFAPTGGVKTKRFDAGEGSEWYMVAPVVDSSNELRSKVIKPARVTGKLTNAALKIYTYDVSSEISIDDLEAGTNSTTGAIPLPDTTNVAQSPLMSVNCPNAVLSTMRIEGDDRGEATRDEVHEALYQQAVEGVRR